MLHKEIWLFILRIIQYTQNTEFWVLNLVVNMRFTNRQSLKGWCRFNYACCVASNVGITLHREFESKREKRVIWLRNWQKCAFQFTIHHHFTFQLTQLMQFTDCTQITPRLPLHQLLISCPRIVIRKKGLMGEWLLGYARACSYLRAFWLG
jgi:hypothetical protein